MDTQEGAKRHGVTVKTLKSALKKAGLKTTGKKATLTRRAKKAKLMGGQISKVVEEAAKTAKGAVGALGETAKGVVGVTEAAVKTPLAAAKAALNDKTGGRHRGRKH
jgi:hypothetical protein